MRHPIIITSSGKLMLREEDHSFDLTELIKMSQYMIETPDWSSCILSPDMWEQIISGMIWNEITNNFELCGEESNG